MSEHSLAFEAVKTAFLRLYELVPEANLQKFPNLMKPKDQRNAEFVKYIPTWTSVPQSPQEVSHHTSSADIGHRSAASY